MQFQEDPNKVTYFGIPNYRDHNQKFGIKAKDRLRHMYIIGKSGVGKSTLIENMVAQDILSGNGCAFLDPHGGSAEKMLEYVPEHRLDDIIYVSPGDMPYPISFNVMEDVEADKRHHVANGLMSVMKKIWVDAFSGRMEYVLLNTILALLEYPDSTILGINRMLAEKEYRKLVIAKITDPIVKSFWVDEFLKWDDKYQRDAGASLQNKIGQFASSQIIRNIIGQPKSTLDFRKAMDERKIVICNLSKGVLGEQNAALLGSMISTKIYLAAMSRAEFTKQELKAAPSFFLYVDEFQNFASDSFADVLAEARKYKLGLTMAHQYIAQLPDSVREAVFGNVGTMVSFLVGDNDAEILAGEFGPTFTQEDLRSLGKFQIYLKLLIDDLTSQPFSAKTLADWPRPEGDNVKQEAINRSRMKYARPRAEVEQEIADWFVPVPDKKQIAHKGFLDKKRQEVEAAGGVWIEHETGLHPRPGDTGPPSTKKSPINESKKKVSAKPKPSLAEGVVLKSSTAQKDSLILKKKENKIKVADDLKALIGKLEDKTEKDPKPLKEPKDKVTQKASLALQGSQILKDIKMTKGSIDAAKDKKTITPVVIKKGDSKKVSITKQVVPVQKDTVVKTQKKFTTKKGSSKDALPQNKDALKSLIQKASGSAMKPKKAHTHTKAKSGGAKRVEKSNKVGRHPKVQPDGADIIGSVFINTDLNLLPVVQPVQVASLPKKGEVPEEVLQNLLK